MIFSWMCIILVILQSFLQLDMALDAGFGPLDLNNLPTSNLERQFPVVALTNKEPWRTHIDIAFERLLSAYVPYFYQLVYLFVHSFIHQLTHFPTHPLIHSFTAFMHSCIIAFIHLLSAFPQSCTLLFICSSLCSSHKHMISLVFLI